MPIDQQNTYDLTMKQWIGMVAVKSVGFIAADFFSHPFYTLWTAQQIAENGKSRRLLEAVEQIVKTRGIKGFFAGFCPQSISAVGGNWGYIGGRYLSGFVFHDNDLGKFMQGPFGVCCGSIIWSPMMTLTMSQQASGSTTVINNYNHLSLRKKAQYLWKTEGMCGFYRGTLPLVLSFSIGDGCGSSMQEKLLDYYPKNERKQFIPQLFATTLAFSMSAIFTSPFEVIFARLKLSASNPQVFKEKTMYAGARAIYTTQGGRGFFKALPAHMMYNTTWHMILPFNTMMDELYLARSQGRMSR